MTIVTNEELLARIDRLETEVQRLSAENSILEAADTTPPDQGTEDDPVTRRGLLRKAVVASAAGAGLALGGSLARPGVTGAATGAWQYGTNGYVNAGDAWTGLQSTSTRSTLAIFNSHGVGIDALTNHQAAVVGHSSGQQGVRGSSFSSNGVYGHSEWGDAVRGEVDNPDSAAGGGFFSAAGGGAGVWGDAKGPTKLAGVVGRTLRQGHGVWGQAYTGSGNGVFGQVVPTGSVASGVYGHTRGPGAGVKGESTHASGRGGQFVGKAAQVRLVPSAATTHPGSGQAGDLFLDASTRLWLCKGGTSWAQVV